MRDDLVDILSDHKTRRLATEQEETAHQRYSKLERVYAHFSTADLREPFPPLGDILNHQLLEYLIWETPTEDNLTEGFFSDKLSELLPDFVQQWRLAKVHELVDMMQRTGVPNATESDLHLATTIFCCTRCNQSLHFPSMFYHSCCLRPEFQPPQSRLQTYQRKSWTMNSLKGVWSSRPICFNITGSNVLKEVVEECGLDPSTAMKNDMDLVNPLVECLVCERTNTYGYGSYGRLFMGWRTSVSFWRHQSIFCRVLNHFPVAFSSPN